MVDSTNDSSFYKRSDFKSSFSLNNYPENEIDKIFLSKAQVTPDEIKIENLKRCIGKINDLFKPSQSSPSLFDFKSTNNLLEEDIINEPLMKISDGIEDIALKYKIYEIQLKQLSDDLETIQKRNSEIEIKINFEKEVLDKLTKILSILNINDRGKLGILEDGHFDRMEDLVKMEESLLLIYNLNNFKCNGKSEENEIGGVKSGENDINVFSKFNKVKLIKKTSEKILRTKKNFYKRFSIFLNSLLLKIEGKGGELRVHKELYESIKKYKFIFIFSKVNSSENFSNRNIKADENDEGENDGEENDERENDGEENDERENDVDNDDYNSNSNGSGKNGNKERPYFFNQIFQSYISYSSNLYMKEFKNHLKSIINLINDLSKLSLSIEILFKSFESLCKVEFNFLKNLTKNEKDLNLGMSLIFGEVSDLILDYLNKMFKKSKIITILSISRHFIIPSNKVDHDGIINDINNIDVNKDIEVNVNQDNLFKHFNLRLFEKLKFFKKLFMKEEGKKLINIVNEEDLKNLEIINFILKQEEELEIEDLKYELIKRMVNNYKKIINEMKNVEENEESEESEIKQIIFINQLFYSINMKREIKNEKFLKLQENFYTFLIFLNQTLSEELVKYIFKEKDIKSQILKVSKMIKFNSKNQEGLDGLEDYSKYFSEESGDKIVELLKVSVFECMQNNVKEKEEIKEFLDNIKSVNKSE